MNAVTHAENLKAARRAELKAAEDAKHAAQNARRAEIDAMYADALAVWLRDQNAEWLHEFHASASTYGFDRTAVFTVPGHATIKVAFTGGGRVMCPIAYERGKWEVAGELYARLDDALIVAEAEAQRAEKAAKVPL